MGSNLCCMKQQEQQKVPISIDQNPISIKKIEEEKKKQLSPLDNKLETKSKEISSLKDCLLNSPRLNPPYVNGGEVQVYTQKPKKVILSSPEVQTEFFTPRISFSAERLGYLGKIDEKDDEEDLCMMSKSRCEKLKKRVSFRLPEEGDIFIFYSPEETVEK